MNKMQVRTSGWAIYLRASIQNPERALESQRAAIHQGIRNSKMEVVEEYCDTGRDGDALQRLVNDARAGRFSDVVVYATDRLGRNAEAVERTLEDLQEAGVCLTVIQSAKQVLG